MKLNVNKNNRYLPKSVGIEIESQRQMIEGLLGKLTNLFPSGNSESSTIYEVQTAPMMTNSIIDVALLGEVVRRCIPDYVEGSSDCASASAHCHVVGFNNDLEEEHIEALMVGLMPFLSLGWLKPELNKYTFRASVSGTGPCSNYGRFVTKDDPSCGHYGGRYTWLKDQTDRHRAPSGELRANENSPLWLYFINPILTNQDMMDRLRALTTTPEFKKRAALIKAKNGKLDIHHDFIEEVKQIVIPFLMDSLDSIATVIKPEQKEIGIEILTAYLEENYKAYNKLIQGLIDADDEVAQTFKIIGEEYEKNKSMFNVVKGMK